MGPESAKTYPGQALVETKNGPGRAKQEIDYGRRGKGYIFGAFQPATGAAFTRPYLSRSTASWVAFLEEVERWLPAEGQRIYAIIDDLSTHRAPDVLDRAPGRGVGTPVLGLVRGLVRLPQRTACEDQYRRGWLGFPG
jgi:hypothetical protein